MQTTVHFYHTRQMYAQIDMKSVSVLPDEGFAPRLMQVSDQLGDFMVECKPKPAPGVRWGHRLVVHCDCGRHVPFGRMNQHWPTHS